MSPLMELAWTSRDHSCQLLSHRARTGWRRRGPPTHSLRASRRSSGSTRRSSALLRMRKPRAADLPRARARRARRRLQRSASALRRARRAMTSWCVRPPARSPARPQHLCLTCVRVACAHTARRQVYRCCARSEWPRGVTRARAVDAHSASRTGSSAATASMSRPQPLR
jgi:hypothetical protein